MKLLPRGAPERKKLDGLQAQIADTVKAAADVEKAPLDLAEARTNVKRALASKVNGKTQFLRFGYSTSEYVNHRLPDLGWEEILALLGPQEVEDRIIAIIAAQQPDRGLPLPKREARLGELRVKLIDLQRREEHEVLALEDQGYNVVRRGDADAKLVLEIWQSKSPPSPAPSKREPGDKPVAIDAINDGVQVPGRPANLE